MSLVWELLSNPGAPLALREAGLERAHSDPGIPRREGSTASFWLKDPHPTVATARSQTWPEETEFAIVGSGIAGLSVAHALLTAGRDKPHTAPRVVVLEARDACSGATGRNGGHVIETGVDYLDLKHAFGQDAATQIVRFRLSHLPALLAVAASVPGLRERSQLRQVEFVTAYYDQTAYEHALASLAEFKADMPAESREFRSHSQDVLKEKFHLSDYAVGAISGPAGAAWPYRFVSGLWAALLQDHASLQLETNTPVSEIQLDAHGQYTLHTPRGATCSLACADAWCRCAGR
uniref:FAD dependent oxidoreductase domain-containing protein n=1 Tax=Phialemonium thermophilum TaxID=223376 RepID=A0ABR3W3R8_9PEZI